MRNPILFRSPVLVLLVFGASAETRTVCEALMDLSDLNGKEVKIRGNFRWSHVGQELRATPVCEHPTIRDGWMWRDAISVWPAGGLDVVSGALAACRRVAKAHPDGHVVVTLTGRLETRDHFEIKTFPNGLQWPLGFGYNVASLLYRSIDHIEAAPLQPGDLERDIDIARQPYAVRAKSDKE
jgi:hypothetical protein